MAVTRNVCRSLYNTFLSSYTTFHFYIRSYLYKQTRLWLTATLSVINVIYFTPRVWRSGVLRVKSRRFHCRVLIKVWLSDPLNKVHRKRFSGQTLQHECFITLLFSLSSSSFLRGGKTTQFLNLNSFIIILLMPESHKLRLLDYYYYYYLMNITHDYMIIKKFSESGVRVSESEGRIKSFFLIIVKYSYIFLNQSSLLTKLGGFLWHTQNQAAEHCSVYMI